MPPALRILPVRNDADWQQVQHIRTRVFIEEQNCPPEEEWDAFDETSRHLLGWVNDVAVATARWRTVPFEAVLMAKLERFAVLADHRGRGYGKAMIQATLDDARRAGFSAFVLHAQAHLQALYASFGFAPVGEVFDEVGIPHITMVKYR